MICPAFSVTEVLPSQNGWLALLAQGWNLPFIVTTVIWGAGYVTVLLERPVQEEHYEIR